MEGVRNPYGPGAGTPPPALVGREGELHAFHVKLQRTLAGRPAKSLLVTGLRGVGKTVLLNRFVDIADGAGYATVFMEASAGSDFVAALAAHVRSLLYELDRRGGLSEKVKRALRVFKSFAATINAAGSLAFSVDIDPERGAADSGDLAIDLTALFVALAEAARDRGRGVLIAIDEVQYLGERELAALIVAVHRTSQLSLPIVVVAAGLPQVPALAGEAKSYSERLFDFPEIGELSPADAARALVEPARAQGVTFTDDATGEIYRVTRGYPFFVQKWGYDVWNAAPGSPIGIDVVRGIHERVIGELDRGFFRVRYDRLTPSQKRYLRAMAELGPGPQRSGEIADRYGAKVTSLAPMRGQLINQGMIYSPAHGDTAFTVPLFDEFLRRAEPDFA